MGLRKRIRSAARELGFGGTLPPYTRVRAGSRASVRERFRGRASGNRNWNRGRSRGARAGVATRTSLVGPAFGLAALLSQSFLATGGPGRIFGSVGGLVAGGTHEITGRGEPLAIALEAFFSIDIQTRLAAQGVLGLGGPRNSDRVQLSVAPMLSSAKEAGGLPAQLLTARSIRFAQWARDQIPTGTPDLDVIAIFEQGAAALLFPNKDVAQMNATVTELEGARMVVLRTRARGEWLGVPMDASFALPLR